MWLLLLSALLWSCSSVKYVPSGQYLLKNIRVHTDNRDLNKEEMRLYIRQHPNKTILGMKFHLWLYSRSNSQKTSKWHEFLRRNGEEPVLWDETHTRNSVQQLSLYLRRHGYYDAVVRDSVYRGNQKAKVRYYVSSGEPVVMQKVGYDIQDSAIREIVFSDTLRALIRPGMLLDEDALQKENERIARLLKDHGYFSFSADNIRYLADTLSDRKKALMTMQIKDPVITDTSGISRSEPYPVYRMDRISVLARNATQTSGDSLAMAAEPLDTIQARDVRFVMPHDFPVDAATIAPLIQLHKDSVFRQGALDETRRLLAHLNTFQLVNFDFNPRLGDKKLDMDVHLLPFSMQSYSVELEGTNSSGNLGGALNLMYQHKSLFGHAEAFNLRLSGMIEALQNTGLNFRNTVEIGIESGITIPKFFFPLRLSRFVATNRPSTTISAQYSFQSRPDYERTLLKATLSYDWKTGQYSSHSVRPVDINFVRLPYASEAFRQQIEGTYLENSYTNHMVPSGGYHYQFNNQGKSPLGDFVYLRFNAETAGFLMNTLFQLTHAREKPYRILGNEFSQFVKSDLNVTYYRPLGGNNLVSRIFLGVGIPYGNSRSIPFERKYYAGGANSNRGWQVRTLGPGSFRDTIPRMFPNSTGDIKLEANLEYRFPLFWIIESALFVDAGNVWDLKKEERRPGADFDWNRFYKEIGVSAGFGVRLDVEYFIIRLDLGMKLRDPAMHRWVDGSDVIRFRNTQVHIGIGYPF